MDFKIYTGSMSFLRMKVVFLAKQYGCSTASFKSRICTKRLISNVSTERAEIQILSGLYWE